MESFSISCGTCAARLKVTRASAVGQVLSCPKCGNMVRVTPPPGWIAPEGDSPESPDGEQSAADLSSGDFDDIESVLAKPGNIAPTRPARKNPRAVPPGKKKPGTLPTAAPKNARKKAAAANKATGVVGNPASSQTAKPNPAGSSASNSEVPMLPDGKWTSPAAKARNRLLTIVGVTVGALIVLGSIIGAVVANRSANTPTVANGESGDVDGDPAEDPDSAQSEIERLENAIHGDADEDTNNEQANNEQANNEQDDEDPGDAPEAAGDSDAAENAQTDSVVEPVDPRENGGDVSDKTTAVVEMQPEPQAPGTTDQVIDNSAADNPLITNPLDTGSAGTDPANNGEPQPVEQNPENLNPLGPDRRNQDILNGGVLSPDSGLSGPGQLSALLQEAGSSILEIQQLANSIRDQAAAGMPKYYIEKPSTRKTINVERQLGLECPGIQYSDVPLKSFLGDISALLGLTFQIDTESWLAAGIPFDTKVDVLFQGDNYSKAIDTALGQLNLTKSVSPEGIIVVRAAGSTRLTESEYDLPPLAGGPDARDNQVNAIKQLVSPESWLNDASSASLTRSGTKINVKQDSNGHWQIRQLFAKVNAIHEILASKVAAENATTLTTRNASASEMITRPTQARYSRSTPIVIFLNQIQKQTGVTILIDWESLKREGWTPATMIPGDFREDSVKAVVTELCASMRLTYRVVDATTLELTTYDSAASKTDLEFYYCGDIFRGPIKEEDLIELFNRTLGPRLNTNPNVRVDYDPELKSIISRAPQPLQKQIEAIIVRLRSISKTNN